jgi:general secretion pathway protein D
VRQWASKLDQPGERAGGRNIFTYTARHLSADALARTLSQLLEGAPAPQAAAAPAAATTGANRPAAGSTTAAASRNAGPGRVVVDPNSNTLIFNTSPENYSQLIGLLTLLDRPAKSALIEVTVAEVSLTDDLNLGVEWLMQNSGASGSTVTATTIGGLALGTGGLTIRRLNSAGDLRLIINALAGSDRATILSSPRIMARNGEQARIQVGQEVPIITSQQSALNNGTGTNLGVLQTVQYRDTGVLLSVKPSIYSGDRIDLDVVQEVSAAQTTQTGVTASPTIATRKVETRLTLEHGATVLLGGLISSDRSDGDGGVPGLKDIPLLGNLFKKQTRKDTRRELIVLITPYIINDGQEAAQITEAFRNALPLLGPQRTTVLPDKGTPPAR